MLGSIILEFEDLLLYIKQALGLERKETVALELKLGSAAPKQMTENRAGTLATREQVSSPLPNSLLEQCRRLPTFQSAFELNILELAADGNIRFTKGFFVDALLEAKSAGTKEEVIERVLAKYGGERLGPIVKYAVLSGAMDSSRYDRDFLEGAAREWRRNQPRVRATQSRRSTY